MAPSDDDPFAAFGDDSDDDDDAGGDSGTKETQQQERDPSCGALVFRPGTEKALVHHVRNGLDPTATSATTLQTQVLQLTDDFCYQRHWMMHVGPEKGAVLDDFLARRFERYLLQETASVPFVLIEVGTYCGYSAIRMADTMLKTQNEYANKNSSSSTAAVSSFHIVTVDVNPQHMAVATQMVAAAGLEAYVTFVLLENPQEIPNELSVKLLAEMRRLKPNNDNSSTTAADLVFLDHAKELYVSDLLQLENAALIQAGTWVAADNVVFFRLNDYQQHMQALAEQGVVETSLCMGKLEYLLPSDGGGAQDETNAQDLRDGLELTMYIQDPPLR